jgi:Fic/DOC family
MDGYPSVTSKATALFHSMIANHPFQNGNKRTAVLAVDAFLMGNGYALVLTNEQMYELAQKTASYKERGLSHEQSFQEIERTFKTFAIPLPLLYREQKKHPHMSKFYKASIAIRKSVRRNPDNKIIRD